MDAGGPGYAGRDPTLTWQVRPARVSELALLPEIERAAARLFPPERIADPDEVHPVEELRGYLDEGLLWVGADGARLTGYVMARELDGALHVYELAVDPAFGRRGIGTALMQETFAEAARRRLPRVTLTTFEDLPWNAPFYRRLGFTVLQQDNLTLPLERILERERAAGMTRRVAMAYRVEAT